MLSFEQFLTAYSAYQLYSAQQTQQAVQQAQPTVQQAQPTVQQAQPTVLQAQPTVQQAQPTVLPDNTELINAMNALTQAVQQPLFTGQEQAKVTIDDVMKKMF